MQAIDCSKAKILPFTFIKNSKQLLDDSWKVEQWKNVTRAPRRRRREDGDGDGGGGGDDGGGDDVREYGRGLGSG